MGSGHPCKYLGGSICRLTFCMSAIILHEIFFYVTIIDFYMCVFWQFLKHRGYACFSPTSNRVFFPLFKFYFGAWITLILNWRKHGRSILMSFHRAIFSKEITWMFYTHRLRSGLIELTTWNLQVTKPKCYRTHHQAYKFNFFWDNFWLCV
jgi:hypothetical protein